MPIHDEYARVTPMELSFPTPEAGAERFEAVAREAEARRVDETDPAVFVLLMEVGRAMRELRVPESDQGTAQHGALLYHLYHCWKAGNPLYAVDTGLVRLFAESTHWTPGRSTPPDPAAYVQLPQHLFWARPDEDAAPESVDGFFWTLSGKRISFLVTMGLRPDRPGFSVAALDPIPLEDAAQWVDADMRSAGGDFMSTLPGADLERLYEIRTAGEVLKLGGRLLLHLESAATGGRSSVPGGEKAASGGGRGPRSSELPYTRLSLPS